MGEKLVPPTKAVGKSDGIKQGSANLTTPNFDSKNGNANWSSGKEGGNIMGKK